ncbi:MAG: hypothetical protein ACYTF0_02825, partial [Planctomycetota bacterium]
MRREARRPAKIEDWDDDEWDDDDDVGQGWSPWLWLVVVLIAVVAGGGGYVLMSGGAGAQSAHTPEQVVAAESGAASAASVAAESGAAAEDGAPLLAHDAGAPVSAVAQDQVLPAAGSLALARPDVIERHDQVLGYRAPRNWFANASFELGASVGPFHVGWETGDDGLELPPASAVPPAPHVVTGQAYDGQHMLQVGVPPAPHRALVYISPPGWSSALPASTMRMWVRAEDADVRVLLFYQEPGSNRINPVRGHEWLTCKVGGQWQQYVGDLPAYDAPPRLVLVAVPLGKAGQTGRLMVDAVHWAPAGSAVEVEPVELAFVEEPDNRRGLYACDRDLQVPVAVRGDQTER